MRGLTIIEAARRLDCPERLIKKAIKDGEIMVIGRAAGVQGRPYMLEIGDVDMFARRRRLGSPGMALRTVLVVDPDGSLSDIVDALGAAGLVVHRDRTLIGALAGHPSNIDRPVVVLERPNGTERNLLESLHDKMYLILVGDVPVLPDDLERVHWMLERDWLRRIVQVAWMLVERRK